MRRGTGWPVAVGVILGTTVAANVWIIRIANADPSFAIEANYYQKALRWDDELAQRERNRTLAWQLTPTLSTISPDSGAELRVALRDPSGNPLVDAAVTVQALHNARAGEPLDVELRRVPAGDYVARLPMHRPGLWELRFDVRRGADHFTARHRLEAWAGTP
ncbi:MAG TPA: FixH family protein [Gemmatimonadaceae bacterium]|nr:FixH family protein [Gemmatimonadaceae bacterium]